MKALLYARLALTVNYSRELTMTFSVIPVTIHQLETVENLQLRVPRTGPDEVDDDQNSGISEVDDDWNCEVLQNGITVEEYAGLTPIEIARLHGPEEVADYLEERIHMISSSQWERQMRGTKRKREAENTSWKMLA
jgi:hypothetical protein